MERKDCAHLVFGVENGFAHAVESEMMRRISLVQQLNLEEKIKV